MFDLKSNVIHEGRVVQYELYQQGKQLTYGEVVHLWQNNTEFRTFYVSILKSSAFETYRWETPAVTTQSMTQPFQFVLINHPGLAAITDRLTFSRYFTSADKNAGIVAFKNLGGDAVLVTPSPVTREDAFNHLALFTRSASDAQNDALWRIVGEEMTRRVSNNPVWLNTAGDGVSWLHIRLDNRPKYYRHAPYKIVG